MNTNNRFFICNISIIKNIITKYEFKKKEKGKKSNGSVDYFSFINMFRFVKRAKWHAAADDDDANIYVVFDVLRTHVA